MKIERHETLEQVRKHIKLCEGKHTQQVSYSTYHDALTQICFTCNKVSCLSIFILNPPQPPHSF